MFSRQLALEICMKPSACVPGRPLGIGRRKLAGRDLGIWQFGSGFKVMLCVIQTSFLVPVLNPSAVVKRDWHHDIANAVLEEAWQAIWQSRLGTTSQLSCKNVQISVYIASISRKEPRHREPSKGPGAAQVAWPMQVHLGEESRSLPIWGSKIDPL